MELELRGAAKAGDIALTKASASQQQVCCAAIPGYL
jgi:hypothetical protein